MRCHDSQENDIWQTDISHKNTRHYDNCKLTLRRRLSDNMIVILQSVIQLSIFIYVILAGVILLSVMMLIVILLHYAKYHY